MGHIKKGAAAMYESSRIIRMNIQHYQELLKSCAVGDSRVPILRRLLADAQEQFPLAATEEQARKSALS